MTEKTARELLDSIKLGGGIDQNDKRIIDILANMPEEKIRESIGDSGNAYIALLSNERNSTADTSVKAVLDSIIRKIGYSNLSSISAETSNQPSSFINSYGLLKMVPSISFFDEKDNIQNHYSINAADNGSNLTLSLKGWLNGLTINDVPKNETAIFSLIQKLQHDNFLKNGTGGKRVISYSEYMGNAPANIQAPSSQTQTVIKPERKPSPKGSTDSSNSSELSEKKSKSLNHLSKAGKTVKELQEKLKEEGIKVNGREINADNAFGQNTLAAVKEYQSKHHLEPDGIVGPKTISEIFGSSSSAPSHSKKPVREAPKGPAVKSVIPTEKPSAGTVGKSPKARPSLGMPVESSEQANRQLKEEITLLILSLTTKIKAIEESNDTSKKEFLNQLKLSVKYSQFFALLPLEKWRENLDAEKNTHKLQDTKKFVEDLIREIDGKPAVLPPSPETAKSMEITFADAVKVFEELDNEKPNLEVIEKLIKGKNINGLFEYNGTEWTILGYAAAMPNMPSTIVDKILKTPGIDINKLSGTDNTSPILYAIYNDNISAIQLLADNGANLNIRSQSGSTIIYRPIYTENIVLLKYLINKGAKLDVQDNWGYSPLMHAIENSNYEIIEFIIGNINQNNINLKNNDGQTALDIAIKGLQYSSKPYMSKVIDLLKAKGAIVGNPDALKEIENKTDLTEEQANVIFSELSEEHPDNEKIKTLLAGKKLSGNFSNKLTYSQYTLIGYATSQNNTDMVRFMLDNGANPNEQYADGRSPLIQAVINGNDSMVKLLLKSGKMTREGAQYKTANGLSALDIAKDILSKVDLESKTRYENIVSFIDLYIGGPFEGVKQQPVAPETGMEKTDISIVAAKAFFVEIEKPSPDINTIRELIKGKKLDVEFEYNGIKTTLLIHAVKLGKEDIVTLLIEEDADINKQLTDGNTALFTAIGKGDVKISKFLLDNGTRLDLTLEGDNTLILSIAEAYRDSSFGEFVKLLISDSSKQQLNFIKDGKSVLDKTREALGIIKSRGEVEKTTLFENIISWLELQGAESEVENQEKIILRDEIASLITDISPKINSIDTSTSASKKATLNTLRIKGDYSKLFDLISGDNWTNKLKNINKLDHLKELRDNGSVLKIEIDKLLDSSDTPSVPVKPPVGGDSDSHKDNNPTAEDAI